MKSDDTRFSAEKRAELKSYLDAQVRALQDHLNHQLHAQANTLIARHIAMAEQAQKDAETRYTQSIEYAEMMGNDPALEELIAMGKKFARTQLDMETRNIQERLDLFIREMRSRAKS